MRRASPTMRWLSEWATKRCVCFIIFIKFFCNSDSIKSSIYHRNHNSMMSQENEEESHFSGLFAERLTSVMWFSEISHDIRGNILTHSVMWRNPIFCCAFQWNFSWWPSCRENHSHLDFRNNRTTYWSHQKMLKIECPMLV